MDKIIVSFTSYPKRINTVYKVLDSIINQTILPDKIILYLSSSEFEGFGELPNLECYEKYGFEIHWHEENLKSHKKWFYVFQEYKNDIVITIDDDILYNKNMLENLLKYHKQFPNCVVGRHVNIITCNENGTIAAYENWCGLCGEYVGMPRMDMEAVGNAGILYPTYLLDNTEIFKKEIFMEKCPYADDIWLKIMEVYNGIPTVLAEKRWNDIMLEEHQKSCLFETHNKDGGNDKQLEELLKEYPRTAQYAGLKDSIFKKGYVTCDDAKKIKERELDNILEDLLKKVQNFEELLIYGAGNLGNRLYNLLKGTHKVNIKAFIVYDTAKNMKKVGTVDVRSYKEFIRSDEKIIIGLYNNNKTQDACRELVKAGIAPARIIILDDFEKLALFTKQYI